MKIRLGSKYIMNEFAIFTIGVLAEISISFDSVTYHVEYMSWSAFFQLAQKGQSCCLITFIAIRILLKLLKLLEVI